MLALSTLDSRLQAEDARIDSAGKFDSRTNALQRAEDRLSALEFIDLRCTTVSVLDLRSLSHTIISDCRIDVNLAIQFATDPGWDHAS